MRMIVISSIKPKIGNKLSVNKIVRRNNRCTTEAYTPGGFVWCDKPFYLVKLSQEKWVCDFHDDAPPLSFQLFHNGKKTSFSRILGQN